ncbi:MAG TPA: site-2 protease family protein, partial [Bacteroidales bacterium]|nr:site-2 protease family protein [Bacteroidales bacterium]
MGNFDLVRILEFLPGIVLGLTVHEFSHALVAHMCGDDTSKEQGRITLNPLKHIDLMGFILILIAGFGWAKPVQFNEQKLHNPKYDIMKIAVAGPVSNALLAMVLSIIFSVLVSSHVLQGHSSSQAIYEIFIYGIYINWGLFIFNLIPLPPLDGSHLIYSQLRRYPSVYNALYKYGSLLLFGLIIGTFVTKIDLLPIWPAIQFLGEG